MWSTSVATGRMISGSAVHSSHAQYGCSRRYADLVRFQRESYAPLRRGSAVALRMAAALAWHSPHLPPWVSSGHPGVEHTLRARAISRPPSTERATRGKAE